MVEKEAGQVIVRAILVVASLLVAGCDRDERAPVEGTATARSSSPFAGLSVAGDRSSFDKDGQQAVRCPCFRDVHEEANLEHVYVNGEAGECLFMETTGAGAGWLDFDADGHWDLYLNQGGEATGPVDERQPKDRLFRNLGDGTFEDVTERAGIAEHGYSQAVAVGDYNNDGFDDVYVTNFGRNTLLHNSGDGTFRDVTHEAGVGDERWSTSAAWADLDLDGDLDLYVANYCVYDPNNALVCKDSNGAVRVCHPRNFAAWPDVCYFNNGDGTFIAASKERGLVAAEGRGLGVAIADFNNDGLPDIYVSNDTTANFLFVNQGSGTFEEMATVMGCALDQNGLAQAGMGIGVNDFDHNGYLDLYVCHFLEESNTVYRNFEGGFQDETGLLGMHAPTLARLTFGTVMSDFNQDGFMDIVTATGHIDNSPANPQFRMAPQVFTFDGDRWHDCSQKAGAFFQGKYVGRAIAMCDYDDDGDGDLVVAHENTPAALLNNESERGHWLKFRMRGRQSNRRGIGCRIAVQAGDTTYTQELCGGTGYAASHAPELIFGLGESVGPCTAIIRWPSGRVQTLPDLPVDSRYLLDENDARAVDDRGGLDETASGNQLGGPVVFDSTNTHSVGRTGI